MTDKEKAPAGARTPDAGATTETKSLDKETAEMKSTNSLSETPLTGEALAAHYRRMLAEGRCHDTAEVSWMGEVPSWAEKATAQVDLIEGAVLATFETEFQGRARLYQIRFIPLDGRAESVASPCVEVMLHDDELSLVEAIELRDGLNNVIATLTEVESTGEANQ